MEFSRQSIEILFGKTDNFIGKFEFIHNKKMVIQDEVFLTPKIFIKQFEKKHKIKIEELKNNRGLLKAAIKEMKEKTDAKIVEIAESLDVAKSTVSKCLRN